METKDQNQPHKNDQNPITKNQSNNNFLYKALTITLFLIVLPLFPSQAPEFINNQALFTRSWEILHLLFVGIAISYGLFSRKNDDEEPEKEHHQNPNYKDNDESYFWRLLHVSSVFDGEPESLSEDSKVQTWSNQYYSNEPVVVVARESAVLDDKDRSRHGDSDTIGEKPLLLPVRSLNETITNNVRSSHNGDVVALPSPIPWRSRSGRFEMREESSNKSEGSSLRSQSSRFSQPEKKSSSSSILSESQAKISEDFMRKKKGLYNKSNPPPAPPPPPPPMFRSNFSNRSMKPSPASEKPCSTNFKECLIPEEESFVDKVFMESDPEETESEGDENNNNDNIINNNIVPRFVERDLNNGKSEGKNNNEMNVSSVNGDVGPDVDKKADEFIAKFREQIRLQRIESIKRSSVRMSKNLSRT